MSNKKRIFEDLINLVYSQTIQRIDLDKVGMPKLFLENKLRWSQLLLRSPKV